MANVSTIKSWFDREIDALLSKFFEHSSNLSKPYWPWAMRSFLHRLIEFVKERPLLMDAFKFDHETLNTILAELEKGKMHDINEANKDYIRDLLLRVQNRPKSAAFVFTKEDTCAVSTDIEANVWPGDIVCREDLRNGFSSCNLRTDISDYLINLLAREVKTASFTIRYNIHACTPIEIEVPSAFVIALVNTLAMAGDGVPVGALSHLELIHIDSYPISTIVV